VIVGGERAASACQQQQQQQQRCLGEHTVKQSNRLDWQCRTHINDRSRRRLLIAFPTVSLLS